MHAPFSEPIPCATLFGAPAEIARDEALEEERVLRFIEEGHVDAGGERDPEAAFRALALAVHAFQREHNMPYARLCDSLHTPLELMDWREIPAVPQSAFKQTDLRAFPASETARTFLTSGTTGGGRGRHHFRSLRLYEAAILAGWRHAGLPEGRPQLILTPPPAAAPESSLSHMMGTLSQLAGESGQRYFLSTNGGGLDTDGFLAAVDEHRRAGRPVLVLGTALAFLHLTEAVVARGISCHLPAGSEAMETGGYKGSGRELTKADLYARIGGALGLPVTAVWNEYGMTELSSQFYTRGLGQPHAGPPWARALVVSPETGQEVAPGETGVLRLFDLANVGSVLAVGTQDLAVRREDGGFELLGRDPAALPPRGCSRAADEMLGSP